MGRDQQRGDRSDPVSGFEARVGGSVIASQPGGRCTGKAPGTPRSGVVRRHCEPAAVAYHRPVHYVTSGSGTTGVAPTPRPRPRDRVWYARLGAAAAALVIGLGGLHPHVVERDVTTRVLAEVAMNHSKPLDLEFVSDDVALVAPALDRFGGCRAAVRHLARSLRPPWGALLLDSRRAGRPAEAA